MATKTYFDGREITLPGVYSTIKSAISNPVNPADYGTVLVIDTGTGESWGGGSGIDGELKSGADSIYTFNRINDYRNYLKGGLFWKCAEGLFFPETGENGISNVIHVKAATTTAPSAKFVATGGGSNGGTFEFKVRDEGFNAITDETRAESTITITEVAEGDSFTYSYDGVILGEYAAISGDTATDVVKELQTDFENKGIVNVINTDTVAGTITISAPAGYGSKINTEDITIDLTGTAASTATSYSGGVDATKVDKGYAYSIETGVNDTDKWIMKFWRGTWVGDYTDDISYNEISKENSPAIMLVQSIEFDNMQDLIDWAKASKIFNQYFVVNTSTSLISGNGSVDSGDVTAISTYIPAIGGTTTYSADNLNTVLEAVKDLPYSFLLFDKYGVSNYIDTNVVAIRNHITNEAKFIKFGVYGGSDETLIDSITISEAFDSERLRVVHQNVLKASQQSPTGFREFPTLYHAAYYIGREAGLAPQIPVTFKSINVDGVKGGSLGENDRIKALDAGVMVTYYDQDFGSFVNLQGVNSLQNNEFLVNPDGTSFSNQLMRIVSQINKELIVEGKKQLLGQSAGVNRNTLSPGRLKRWTENYLQSRTANPNQDNLILSYRDVTVERQEDGYYVTYGIIANTEITKLFFTGFLFE